MRGMQPQCLLCASGSQRGMAERHNRAQGYLSPLSALSDIVDAALQPDSAQS